MEVEIKQIDRKYEPYRMKSSSRERLLITSILTGGIEEPLSGVIPERGAPILLDGFKRLRCAERLKIATVPFASLGSDEGNAILNLLRASNSKSLSLLEQTRWVDELKRVHGLSIAEIAKRLERSKSWVCVRLNVMGEMTETISREIFSDRFPGYCFLYTLREFRRLNGVPKSEIDTFVKAVSGKGLSVRNIDGLARLYFRGGDKIRDQIRNGDLDWCLKRIRGDGLREDFSEFEKRVLRDSELVQGSMGRLTMKLKSPDLETKSFFAEAHLMAAGILSRVEKFLEVLRRFHDRHGQESGSGVTLSAGNGDPGDLSPTLSQPQLCAQNIKALPRKEAM